MGIWGENTYIIKQKVLTIGRKYYIENGSGQPIGFCKQKIFKLKEDIRIFTSEEMTHELLTIRQEQILDFSGTFTVHDAQTGEHVGYIGRKGLKSIIRDTWMIFDPNRVQIGMVEEASGVLAAFRRFVNFLKWVPKTYYFQHNGQNFATAKQKFQIIGDTWTVTLDPGCTVDARLIVTAGLMMDIVEQQRGR